MKYFKNQRFQKSSLIKVGPKIKYSSQKKKWNDSTNFRHWKMTLKFRILRSLTRLFIILVNLTMPLFIVKKCLFSIDALVVWCPTRLTNLGRSLDVEGADRLYDGSNLQLMRLFSRHHLPPLRRCCHDTRSKIFEMIFRYFKLSETIFKMFVSAFLKTKIKGGWSDYFEILLL